MDGRPYSCKNIGRLKDIWIWVNGAFLEEPPGQREKFATGNLGSVIVPQYGSRKIAVVVWGTNTILKFVGNTG